MRWISKRKISDFFKLWNKKLKSFVLFRFSIKVEIFLHFFNDSVNEKKNIIFSFFVIFNFVNFLHSTKTSSEISILWFDANSNALIMFNGSLIIWEGSIALRFPR